MKENLKTKVDIELLEKIRGYDPGYFCKRLVGAIQTYFGRKELTDAHLLQVYENPRAVRRFDAVGRDLLEEYLIRKGLLKDRQ